jgi:2-polyprenyl-6-methoxyphenol hydroxylase-like FAD-dependent oxidoreductase
MDFSRLKTRFPFIALMPQAQFLEYLIGEARDFPSFQIVMAASVQELVDEGGVVRGVRYRGRDGWHELRSDLVVGADGRFSAVRRLSGLPPAIATSPPMDILWFRLPRRPDDPEGLVASFGSGRPLILLDRGEQWQVGYIIPKGTYQRIHAAGLAELRRSIADLSPLLADRVGELEDWKQVSLLSVASDRLPLWYRPGLLLIGDAAHVMSPVGGNGINYAVQDAVAAANLLAGPLRSKTLSVDHLAAVQHRRARPVRITQAIVTLMQNLVLRRILDAQKPVEPPAILRILPRLPLVPDLMARWLAFGLAPEHVRE